MPLIPDQIPRFAEIVYRIKVDLVQGTIKQLIQFIGSIGSIGAEQITPTLFLLLFNFK
jgi:hypothetical protein